VALVTEEGVLAASGNVLANDSDADSGAHLSVAAPGSYSGAYGTLVLAQDGSYTYSLDNTLESVQSLAAGQTVVDRFDYVATDGQALVASNLAVTITGTNDAPVVTADVAQVGEDGSLPPAATCWPTTATVDAGTRWQSRPGQLHRRLRQPEPGRRRQLYLQPG
jgi:VCBS repeat-containing protein